MYRGVSRSRSARAGIVVPRHGHTIVERNRLKRRLREVIRTEWLPGARGEEPPPEILVRARPGAYGADASELAKAFFGCVGGGE